MFLASFVLFCVSPNRIFFFSGAAVLSYSLLTLSVEPLIVSSEFSRAGVLCVSVVCLILLLLRVLCSCYRYLSLQIRVSVTAIPVTVTVSVTVTVTCLTLLLLLVTVTILRYFTTLILSECSHHGRRRVVRAATSCATATATVACASLSRTARRTLH